MGIRGDVGVKLFGPDRDVPAVDRRLAATDRAARDLATTAALAFDPPVPFRWSYSVLQGGGALVGWLLGAAIGPGTVLVIFLLGPAVDLVSRRVRFLDIHASSGERRTVAEDELCGQ